MVRRPLTLLAAIAQKLAPRLITRRAPDVFERSLPPLRYSRFLEEQNRAARASADRLKFCPRPACKGKCPGSTPPPPPPADCRGAARCGSSVKAGKGGWPRIGDGPANPGPVVTPTVSARPTRPPSRPLSGGVIDLLA